MPNVEPAGAPRILLVEDEAIIAHDIRRRLERLDYDVVGVADNGSDAVKMAREMPPDLVFMDIVIQGPMDGVDTARRLQGLMDVPIVFLTAHTDDATLQRAKRVGPYGYLTKPFEERELRTTIEMALYRHRMESQARLLQHAIATANTGIAVVEVRHQRRRIIQCNRTLEQLTGYSRPDLLSRDAEFLLPDGESCPGTTQVRAALQQGERCEATLPLRHADGSQVWADVSVSPVLGRRGEVTHLLCFYSDATARKEAEAALAQTHRMEAIARLTGGIAHDFNNILSVILAYSEFVQDQLPEGDPGRDDIAEVLQAARRAAGLTRQLLTLARQDPEYARQPLDLNRSLAELEALLCRTVGEGVEVRIELTEQPAVVRMNPVHLDQIVLNLAVNARDAMGGRGVLGVALSRVEDTVRLVVTDTGVGMDEATRQRVFDPFFTTKGSGRGTGLGLATVHAIVRDCGGRIDIRSEPGQGTTVEIELPYCPEPPVAGMTLDPDSAPSRPGARLLVAEDDPVVLAATSRILSAAGYELTCARDGLEAIEMLDAVGEDLDLVVTDVVMPGQSGLQVAEHAARVTPDTPVLLTTGYLNRPVGEGSDLPLIWKPFTARELLRAVDGLLAQAPERPARRRSPQEVFEDALHSLDMVFQPLVRGNDRSVYGWEALMRHHAPALQTPRELLDAAGTLGRTGELEQAVRRAVASTLGRHPQTVLFTNVEPRHLSAAVLCRDDEPLAAFASRVVLEVPERVMIDGGVGLVDEVARLRDHGYRVAVDGLGEGCGGLVWVARLRPDVVKVDISLVRAARESAVDRELVAAIARVCRSSGIMVVAEGIESADEADLMVELGCELLQGYWLGRPGAWELGGRWPRGGPA